MYKKVFFIITIVIFTYSFGLSQEDNKPVFPRTDLQFYILESNLVEGKFIDGDLHDLHFTKYKYGELPYEWPDDDRMITLRAKLNIDSSYMNQDIYLVVLPSEYPCQFYFNQNQIAIRGNYKNAIPIEYIIQKRY